MSVVKSWSVGNGDMFYIKHNSDNFTIIDCCMPDDDRRDEIINEISSESAEKDIIRFISTHPDQDHLCGLVDLDDRMKLRNFYCVKNDATKDDESEDFGRYCELRDHTSKAFYIEKGSKRKWMNDRDNARDPAGIHVLWPVLSNEHYQAALEDAHDGHCPNNISTILTYSLKEGATFMWMGDLENRFYGGHRGER